MSNDNLIENHELVGRALNNQLRPVLSRQMFQYNRANEPQLTKQRKAWLDELSAIRNDWAHANYDKFTDAYVERALDTMMLFCKGLDDEIADKFRAELQKFQALHPNEAEIDDGDLQFFHLEGDYPSWSEVIRPNPDVEDGTFKKAEFAADLSAVAAGESKLIEYQDATEFFRRTYLTAGMKRLMLEALDRLVKGNGEPVIEVKTPFGGGKTHSMMALYHLFNRKYNPLTVDEGVQKLLVEAQISDLPNDIAIAVVVGTALNPERASDIPELEGVQAHTLMGEMFSQLARSAGRFDLYEKYIRLNDERGTSPGVKDLRAFLDGCGGCLILIDEPVPYGKKIYKGLDDANVNFDRFIVFLQELTEAVRTSERSILVVSLPQSEIEIGVSDGGREVLRTIEHHFGRVQSVWSPVEAHESFEIVRRRLFQPCRLEKERDEICAEFASMYSRGSKIFPIETREARYINRMKACYPIHPMLFDLLYERWATIEKFQRTRGVLRLMATIVHKLYEIRDRRPMIMPGSIVFDKDVVGELLNYLPSNWQSIIDKEIDGEDSAPRRLEETAHQKQQQMGRRLTRTLFMGSAPTARGQNVRGLELKEIMLGVLMPSDRSDAGKFKDMLGKLKSKLTYLYSNETHYWFDGRPTLRKVAEAKEQTISDEDVRYEIIDRLDTDMKLGSWFNAKHITSDPTRVPDAALVRLVVLPPDVPYERRSNEKSPTLLAAEKILMYAGKETERLNKNMLLFLAGDKAGLDSLKKLVRQLMAWTALSKEREERNFDRKQLEEIEKNIAELERSVKTQESAAYNYLLEPTAPADKLKKIDWQVFKLNCMDRPNIEVIGERLRSGDSILWNLAPNHLAAELEKYVFKRAPHISLKDLWEYLTRYLYAPRLYDRRVLFDAVRIGVREGVFGLAESFDEESGNYIGLVMNEPITIESLAQLLVRREAAEAQLKIEEPLVEEDTTSELPPTTFEPEVDEELLPTRFSMVAALDLERPSHGIDRAVNEIVDILTSLERADISIELVIRSHVPDGIPEPEAEALQQNCQLLKAKSFRLDP